MSTPLEYGAVPKPLIEGMERLGSPPPPGGGRLRLDMSLNVWTLIAVAVVFVVALFALDRLHSQVELLSIELKSVSSQQSITNQRLGSMENRQMILQRDLRSFPLHRHINGSRVEIYPPKHSVDDDGEQR